MLNRINPKVTIIFSVIPYLYVTFENPFVKAIGFLIPSFYLPLAKVEENRRLNGINQFQLEGSSIKYESIRQTIFCQQLKPSNN